MQRAILRVIGEVELVKMLNPPLTPQQRHALMLMLSDWSMDEIIRTAKEVMKQTTFGNIAFEYWHAAHHELPDIKARRIRKMAGLPEVE